MKFLIDAQLPPRLTTWLTARGHTARHIAELAGGLRMSDAEIWAHAITADEIVLTKDRDFLDIAAVRGSPPVVLLVALGNSSTTDLITALDSAWVQIESEIGRVDTSVVTIERGRLTVLRRS